MSAPALAPDAPALGGATDYDVLHASYKARAVALSSESAKLAAADALVADVVASGITPAVFKGLAGTIGKAAGLDASVLLKQMTEARAAVGGGAAAPVAGARPPSGMHNPDPSPSPDPLKTTQDAIVRAVERQVVCSQYVAIAFALWSAGTYGAQRAAIFPRLVFTSATKRCGKSTALGLLKAIVSTPAKFDNVSASALFRLIEGRRPTILIDEVDSFFKRNEDLRGVANAGYEQSGAVLRCVPTPDGKSFVEAEFNVFCPMALAGIGGLPETVLDRSVICTLARAPMRGAGSRRRPMRDRELKMFRALVAPQLVAHAEAIGLAMEAGTQNLPSELSDRAQDNWEPLLALADLAGGSWPARARAAALALSPAADTQGVQDMLLSDLKSLVTAATTDAINAYVAWRSAGRTGARPVLPNYIRSAIIVHELQKMEHRPWPEYGKDGKGITPVRLAKMLRLFQIGPMDQRMPIAATSMIPGKPPALTEVVKVYSVAALRAIFRQYL